MHSSFCSFEPFVSSFTYSFINSSSLLAPQSINHYLIVHCLPPLVTVCVVASPCETLAVARAALTRLCDSPDSPVRLYSPV